MEKFNEKNYRDTLAKDLKGISDHGERAEVLESEKGSMRYMTAQERHLIAVGEHPEKMRLARLEEIEFEKRIVPRISETIKKACEKIEKDGRPFPEEESYYSRSSHSNWSEVYGYHRWLGKMEDAKTDDQRYHFRDILRGHLERLGDTFPEWKHLGDLLDKFAVMGYVLSAANDELDYDKNPDRWFHFPLGGAYTTLDDYIGNDPRTVPYSEESQNPFPSDEKIRNIAKKIENILEKLDNASIKNSSGFVGRYDTEKRQKVLTEIIELRDEIKEVDISLANEIAAQLEIVAQKLEEEEKELKAEE